MCAFLLVDGFVCICVYVWRGGGGGGAWKMAEVWILPPLTPKPHFPEFLPCPIFSIQFFFRHTRTLLLCLYFCSLCAMYIIYISAPYFHFHFSSLRKRILYISLLHIFTCIFVRCAQCISYISLLHICICIFVSAYTYIADVFSFLFVVHNVYHIYLCSIFLFLFLFRHTLMLPIYSRISVRCAQCILYIFLLHIFICIFVSAYIYVADIFVRLFVVHSVYRIQICTYCMYSCMYVCITECVCVCVYA